MAESGHQSGITRDGIGYELHWNVEVNSKSMNRKMSVGIFYQGGVNIESDQRLLRSAGGDVNQIVFELTNDLENKQRRMNGFAQVDPRTGTVVYEEER